MDKRFLLLAVVALAIVIIISSLVWLPHPSSSNNSYSTPVESNPIPLKNYATNFVAENGKVFVVDRDGYLFCFDSQTEQLLWNVSVTGHPTYYEWYHPIVYNLQAFQGLIITGLLGGTAKAFNESSGVPVFQTGFPPQYSDIDVRFMPQITVAFGVLVVSTSLNTDGFNASTGDLVWSRSDVGGPYMWYPIGDNIFFCTNTFTAINAVNGVELWNFNGSGPLASFFSEPQPVQYNNNCLLWNDKNALMTQSDVFSPRTFLSFVDSARGNVLWRINIHTNMYQPTVANGTVYVGASDGYIYAINLANGYLRWKEFVDYQHLSGNSSADSQQTSVAPDGSQVLFDNGRLFYNVALNSSQSGYNGSVICLNADTGSRIWSMSLQGNNTVNSPTSLSLNNGTLYATQQGDLYLINENQGKIELKRSFDNYILPPIIANDSVYVAADLNIYAFRTK